jgi:hypothetical protein
MPVWTLVVVTVPSSGVGKFMVGSFIVSVKIFTSCALPSQPLQTNVKQRSKFVTHITFCVGVELLPRKGTSL